MKHVNNITRTQMAHDRNTTGPRKVIAACLAAALVPTWTATAGQDGYAKKDASSMKRSMDASMKSWEHMQGKVFRVSDLLSGDVTNGFNTVGNVDEVILTPDSRHVQYILYDVPFPYRSYGSDDGFVTFDKVELVRGARLDTDARMTDDGSAMAPEQLRLTRSQVDHRAASRIIGEDLVFTKDKAAREIQDMLVDRSSGRVTHYVVEMDPDALFNDEPRAIPAMQVKVDKSGNVSTDVALSRVDAMQEYSPGLF